MIFNATRASGCEGIKVTAITVAPRRFTGYKYSFCLALLTISHTFTFLLRIFPSPSSPNHNRRPEEN
jgi:hypothetical protein